MFLCLEQPTIQLFPLDLSCHSSWLIAQQKLVSHHNGMPFIRPSSQRAAPSWPPSVSVLRYGHGGEDQTDEAKDEQVQAGSWFWLKTGAGLPEGKENMSTSAEFMLQLSGKTRTLFTWFQCAEAIWRVVEAAKHANTHNIMCVSIDVCMTHRYRHKNLQKQCTAGKGWVQLFF